MKIRRAKESDIEQICELGFKLLKYHTKFRKYYHPIKDSTKRKRLQRKYFRTEMKRRNGLFLVIDDEGKIAGYSISKIEKDPPILLNYLKGTFAEIFVEEEYRNQGWGTKLLQTSLDWFKKKKIKRAIVAYDAKNKKGENFYKGAGFGPFQNQYEVYLK